jgi:hypothetical protein
MIPQSAVAADALRGSRSMARRVRGVRFEALIDIVGEERYRRACDWAWDTAIDTGAGVPRNWPDGLDEVPHDLSDPIWYDGDIAMGERLALGIRLLREMPCYGNTMYMVGLLRGVGAGAARSVLGCLHRDA